MHRFLALLLTAYLTMWVPLGFAGELLGAWPSLGMRGAPAVAELLAHGAVAILSLAAGWMLWSAAPAAPAFAAVAVVASGVVSIQSLFWTFLPRHVAPGEGLPVSFVVCARTVLCLLVLRAGRGTEKP